MGRVRRRKCLHCNQLFHPDARNRRHQRYCSESECRRASKAASQRRWLAKPENRDYFRGPHHVDRVRQWRQAHPGYARAQRSLNTSVLQEPCDKQPIDSTDKTVILAAPALQDLLVSQPAVLIGLIANLTGSTLPEDIARSGRHLQQLGRDILATGVSDEPSSAVSRTPAPVTDSVQLDRPATGPP